MVGLPLLSISVATLLIIHVSFSRAMTDHYATPSCGSEDKNCEFNWKITEEKTMVFVDKIQGTSHPVVHRDGRYWRRITCDVMVPMTDEDMSTVLTGDGSYKMVKVINGQLPGPKIVVYEGQQVVVKITNHLVDEGVTIHWHGMYQHKTPWMDGVAFVTQCPITPASSFTYRFIASPAGTHWYHSHLGTQRTDGLAGALVVLPRDQADEISNVAADYLMLITDWISRPSIELNTDFKHQLTIYHYGFDSSQCYDSTKGPDGGDIGNIPFESALINGKGRRYSRNGTDPDISEHPVETFTVNQGSVYRFRIINTGSLYMFRVAIDEHPITVIAMDGFRVEPITGQSVVVNTGEIIDMLITTDKPPGNYWIRLETLEYTTEHGETIIPGFSLGILHYSDVPISDPTTTRDVCSSERHCRVINSPVMYPRIYNVDAVAANSIHSTPISIQHVPVPPEEEIQSIFLNLHFRENHAHGFFVPTVNKRIFVYPPSPPLISSSESIVPSCDLTNCAYTCSCTYVVRIKTGKPVQITFLNQEEFAFGIPHPVHLHGHEFHLLKMQFPYYDPETEHILRNNDDIVCADDLCAEYEWRNQSWGGNNIPGLNLVDPPIRDTVSIPAGGYIVVRFMANNPGWWLIHCHIEVHQLNGMAILIKAGEDEEINPPPEGFPSCNAFPWTDEEFQEKLKWTPRGQTLFASQNTHASSKTDDLLASNPSWPLSGTMTLHVIAVLMAVLVVCVFILACVGIAFLCMRNKSVNFPKDTSAENLLGKETYRPSPEKKVTYQTIGH